MMDIICFVLFILYYVNNKKGLALICLTGLITQVFLLIETKQYIGNFSYQVFDLGLIALGFIIFYEVVFQRRKLTYDKELRYLLIWGIFVLITIFIDLLVYKNEYQDVLSTKRNWIFLIFIFCLNFFNKDVLLDYIRILNKINILLLVVYFLQYIIAKPIFYGYAQNYSGSLANFRFLNFPSYLYVTFFYYLFNKDSKYRLIILSLISLAFLLPITRSLIIGIIFSTIIVYLLLGRKMKTIAILIPTILVIYIGIDFIPGFNPRMEQGVSDIDYLLETNVTNIKPKDNLSFRIALLYERMEYISSKPLYQLFGIGSITESRLPHAIFNVGLKENNESAVTQLDTADIGWVILVLRYGFIGVVLYLIIYLIFIKNFINRISSNYAKIAMGYLSLYLFFSVIGSGFVNGMFWVVPLILFKIVKYETS